MYPLVEPRQRPERFLLNRFSPLAESAAFLGLGGFDAAGSVWYPDAMKLLGAVPNDGTLTNMNPATDWVWTPELGRFANAFDGSTAEHILLPPAVSARLGGESSCTAMAWVWRDAVDRRDSILDLTINETSSKVFFDFQQDNTLRCGGRAQSTDSFQSKATAAAFGAKVWMHCAATMDIANDNIYLKVNGIAQATGGTPSWTATAFDSDVGTAHTIAATAGITNLLAGRVSDLIILRGTPSVSTFEALADPSNVMLEVGGVPLILPPRRVAFPAAVAEPVLTYRNYILGGGVI